jgi:hypothetical protein
MIYVKYCPICEAEFRTNVFNKMHCSHACANKGRALRASARSAEKVIQESYYDKSLEWIRTEGRWECPYEGCVSCEVRICDKCGWNPEVAKSRLEDYLRKCGVECER